MRRLLLAALAAVLMLTPTTSPARHHGNGCHHHACVVRVWSKQCSNARPRACVEYQIARHRLGGWQASWLRRIPGCESGWNPTAYFGNPSNRGWVTTYVYDHDISAGLYEFKPSTWDGTPQRRRFGKAAIWIARRSSGAAVWMLRHGRSSEWVCQ